MPNIMFKKFHKQMSYCWGHPVNMLIKLCPPYRKHDKVKANLNSSANSGINKGFSTSSTPFKGAQVDKETTSKFPVRSESGNCMESRKSF